MDIFEIFRKNTNTENAKKMKAYMKDNFAFLGITKPLRMELSSEFLKNKIKTKITDWDFIFKCYDQDEREFQYLAIDYLTKMQDYLEKEDIFKLEKLITSKSWWDTTDSIDTVVGHLCQKFIELRTDVILRWAESQNTWLKRVSINFQLHYGYYTDTDILVRVILQNCDSSDYFINKAIGWSLREYSKSNPKWVKQFLERHKLNPMSIKEASKYLE